MGLFGRRKQRAPEVATTVVTIEVDSDSDLDEPTLIMRALGQERGLTFVELDVVGESHRQDALEQLAGPKAEEGKRHIIGVVLRCEPTNEYDQNAVRVEALGLHLGYVPRDAASHLAPAMSHRSRGVLEGFGMVVGGWDDGDSQGSYGVRVWVDSRALETIGVAATAVAREHGQPTRTPSSPRPRMDTGLSDAWDTDGADDSYDLSWYDTLPTADRPAIARLRGLLATERDPLDRHFQFAELERRLYHARELYDTALDEFDLACEQHDGEMDDIRLVFIEKWGQVPRIEMYRQIAIRKAKAKEWDSVLRWSERGIAIYGSEAAREEAVEDLIKRRNQALSRLSPAPKPNQSGGTGQRESQRRPASDALPSIEVLVCGRCSASFERPRTRGRKPLLCPTCRSS